MLCLNDIAIETNNSIKKLKVEDKLKYTLKSGDSERWAALFLFHINYIY